MFKSVKEIMEDYLKDNCYDGLYWDGDLHCSCKIDDLIHCGNSMYER